jgi:hypothetical protein
VERLLSDLARDKDQLWRIPSEYRCILVFELRLTLDLTDELLSGKQALCSRQLNVMGSLVIETLWLYGGQSLNIG